MFKLPAGRFSSHILHDALLTGQKSHGSRRKHVLQKSQWQAESSWFQCQPSLSITTKTWSTSHSVHKEQPTLIAAQVLTAAGAGGMSPVFQISAGHCELWPLIFKEKETISWITASYHCHSCLNLQEQEEMQEPAPTTPASLSTRRSCYRNANLPRHIILRSRFTSVLTESICNHMGLLLLCLSQLKVGQPGDSTPPFWCRWEVELALMHTELLPRCLGYTAQAAGGNGSTSNSSKHTETGTQKLLLSL